MIWKKFTFGNNIWNFSIFICVFYHDLPSLNVLDRKVLWITLKSFRDIVVSGGNILQDTKVPNMGGLQ